MLPPRRRRSENIPVSLVHQYIFHIAFLCLIIHSRAQRIIQGTHLQFRLPRQIRKFSWNPFLHIHHLADSFCSSDSEYDEPLYANPCSSGIFIFFSVSVSGLRRHNRSLCSISPQCDRLRPIFPQVHPSSGYNCRPAVPETPDQHCLRR